MAIYNIEGLTTEEGKTKVKGKVLVEITITDLWRSTSWVLVLVLVSLRS